MIYITTLQDTKDILSQFLGDKYYVIDYQDIDNSLFVGYWLVKIMGQKKKVYNYSMITTIPENVIYILLDEGYLVPEISEKEWDVQVALGTAPYRRRYLIKNKVEK